MADSQKLMLVITSGLDDEKSSVARARKGAATLAF